MSLSEDDVTKIAKLARIAISTEEKKILSKELSNILSFVSQLQEVDTNNTQRMTSVSNATLTMRKDEATSNIGAEKIIKNAPMSEYNCFVVPKVIE